MRKSLFGKAVSVFALVMFAITMNVSMGYTAAPAIKMRHDILEYFVAEKRIMVQAEVTQGAAGVKLMRCYFRATEYADYVFVGMTSEKDGVYRGILPAPSKDTKTIQYLFLFVDQGNKAMKTQVFMVNKQDDKDTSEWQQVSSDGDIKVSTESDEAPKSVPGFSDSITTNVVESSARFGAVASGTVATGTAATAGTAAAGVGLSTGTMIGIGVGAAALIGGVAMIDSGGGEDTISTWEFRSKCANSSVEAPVVFNVQLNETKGGSFSNNGIGQRDDYEGGISIDTTLTGTFDAKTRVLSGIVSTTTNKLPFSCTRRDNFSTSVPSGINDTGYQNAIEEGSIGCGTESGCVLQVRFIRR